MNFATSKPGDAAILQRTGGAERFYLNPLRVHAVGRAEHTNIRLFAPETSKVHAIIFWDGRQWNLVDCSANGTSVNGQNIHRSRLSRGDRISFARGPEWVFTTCTEMDLPPEDVIGESLDVGYLAIEPGYRIREWQMIGNDASTARLRDEILKTSDSSTSVLITGEFGVGKHHYARALHAAGQRRKRAYAVVDCEGIGSAELERVVRPLVQPADTDQRETGTLGTMIWDKIDLLPNDAFEVMQHILSEHAEFRRRGEYGEVPLRMVALAANDPQDEHWSPEKDQVLTMLSVVRWSIPPLRERHDDLAPLANHLFLQCSRQMGRRVQPLSADAVEHLRGYDWPGNVAELRNVMERAVIISSRQELDAMELERAMSTGTRDSTIFMGLTLEDVERRHIEETLRILKWRKTQVARVLGIERSTLDRKIKRYEIARSTGDAE